MIKMRHYIITRFNLGLYRTGGHDSDEWFEKRFRIFSDVTMPSLIKQTRRNFTHLILVDADSPEKHKRILSSLESWSVAHDYRIVLLYIPLAGNWRPKRYGERWSCAIDYSPMIEYMRDKSKTIVQTRLDNDDALMPQAIEAIQKHCVSKHGSYLIDFRNGYVIDTINKKAYYAQHPSGTPFISLYQQSGEKITSIYDMTHQKMVKQYLCNTRPDRIWVMNIHDHNVSNRLFPWMIEGECDYDNSIPGCI
jgi:hypothetical protein